MMNESKKIKKLEKVNKNNAARFKKEKARPSRAKTETIIKPPRAFDESEVYLIESDQFFGIKDGNLFFDLSMLNLFKYITSVEVRKDLAEKVVTLLLEPKQNYPVSSWHTVVNDLDASQSSILQQWTETLKIFGPKYEAFLKEFEALKKENNMQKRLMLYKIRQQAAAKRLFVLSSYPAFEMRYRMKKSEVKLTELCFNETFLKEVGYTLENFTSTVLTEGLPQIFPRSEIQIAIAIHKSFMENYMGNEIETPELEAQLYMKSGYCKKVTFQTVTLVELSEGELILSLVVYYKTKSLPFGSYQVQPYSSEFLDVLRSNDKEKGYLFSTYYGETIQGFHSNTEKVCKIKEISPSE